MARDAIRSRGVSLVELLVVLAIIGVTAATAASSLDKMLRRRELASAASELRLILNDVRQRALNTGYNTAVKFRLFSGVWHYAIFEDGDGDGVRNDDIAERIDLPVTPFRRVLGESSAIQIGLPPVPMIDPDNGIVMPGESPVRFNDSALCSFSPLTGGSSGSVYLTDGVGGAVAVRVYGLTYRVRTVILEPAP